MKYYENKFKEDLSVKEVWKTAYEFLGTSKNPAPTKLLINGKISTTPSEMAEELNSTFINKVKNLVNSLDGPVTIDPIERLNKW